MCKKGQEWTSEDVEFLKSNYNSMTASELSARFPSRSIGAIRKKALKCGLYVSKDMEFANRSAANSGESCNFWKGGRRITPKGYSQVLRKGHHRADRFGYVMEHILVWEDATGIPVTQDFVVHHLDGDKLNNDISNLCLMKFGAHSAHHNRQKRRKNNA